MEGPGLSTSKSLYLGSGLVNLTFVEVIPLGILNEDEEGCTTPIPLSAPLVKLHLCQKTLHDTISENSIKILWETDSSKRTAEGAFARGSFVSGGQQDVTKAWAYAHHLQKVIPIINIPSANPTQINPSPCWIVGYKKCAGTAMQSDVAVVSDETLVRVLPVMAVAPITSDPNVKPMSVKPSGWNNSTELSRSLWEQSLLGESCGPRLSDSLMDQVLCNHSQGTIEGLSLRMSLLLSETVSIGTTEGAFIEQEKRRNRQRAMQSAVKTYCGLNTEKSTEISLPQKAPSLLWDGALVVHSPHHGAGKTLLVNTIAHRYLKCDAVHVISPGALMAQYGIHGDASLESMLHGIAASAAFNCDSICIILDHLDCLLPPRLSGRTGAGDAAIPVLNGIASYLKTLTESLKRKHRFPFPVKNPLYNLKGKQGAVLPLNICLVGIVTCADDGGRRASVDSRSGTVLDALGGGRFRLPELTAKCRLKAFQSAFKVEQVCLSENAADRLPVLAASAVTARGDAFERVATRLAVVKKDDSATLHELEEAMSILKQDSPSSSSVEFSARTPKDRTLKSEKDDLFASVGGNTEAKLALEEALAIDPSKRALLARFGMKAPSGVLLYGPPGTGKTLLAKAVAKVLRSGVNDEMSLGGAFISLEASNLVRAEVGNSEKLLVSAFETARANAPSVIFIDEFQAIFTERSGSGSGRMASTLLQCMDDVSNWSDAEGEVRSDGYGSKEETNRVVVMAASNVPWMIDKAFLRPGRFDRVVYVGLPTLDERISILKVHISRMRLSENEDEGRLCEKLASTCEGFSGADLFALCRAAAVRCLGELNASGAVEMKHFMDALQNDVRASSDSDLLGQLKEWKP